MAEQHADTFAELLVGRRPVRTPDAGSHRLEGTAAPAYLEALTEAAHVEPNGSRRVPDDFRAQFGSTADRVRFHSGEAAGIAARAVGAQAFTLGHDVYFARGKLQPDRCEGRSLIAHEMFHALAPGGSNPIARTPGVAYPDEQTTAREAFKYLLARHPDKLKQEWGGYIYQQRDSGSFFHSEPRTDNSSGFVIASTEEYARAQVADQQAEWDRRAARGEANPGPRPAEFSPTPGWVEPRTVEKRGGVITAEYHTHPKLGHSGNKAPGFSAEQGQPSAGDPFAPKWIGDIPQAHRSGRTIYMIDLDIPTKHETLGYDLQTYTPKGSFAGLDEFVGIPAEVGNEYKCQWGFAPDGTLDTDGKACAGVAPHQNVIKYARQKIESREFAVAVQLGDLPLPLCLRWLAAADWADETMRCGVDPRSPERRALDEHRQFEAMVEQWRTGGVTAHSLLGPEDDPMRPPR